MKSLHGTASGTVSASAEECWRLLAAVENYPRWHPDVVRMVKVLESDDHGRASKVRAALHVTAGPFAKDFELTLAVAAGEPGTVKLTRLAHEPGDEEQLEMTWRVQGSAPVRLQLEFEARLDVPRLLPTSGIGETIAAGFVAAASTALESARA